MSNHIAILPEQLTNKIAAGEVVERPASVIKELIENALDADATDITVEVAGGGRRRIRISDNGHGMSRDDALLSLERHATSKIRADSDLDAITTLGFRGEALPSIASVSRFTLASRLSGALEGVEITVEGGKIRDVRACGMAPGTVITVEQLFFNIPARLKFLKSAETEAGHLGDAVTRMAVSRPDVAFSLTSEGKELLKVQRGDLLRRLGQLVGKDAVSHLCRVDSEGDHASLSGYISSPRLLRSGPGALYTYINGRFVRDKVVQHAIMQAYRGVIDRGRYPVAALFITLPPGEVDVNVHPTKHEVRFRRQSLVHDAIQSAIEEVLRLSPWLCRPVADTGSSAVPPPARQAYRERIAAAAQASLDMPRRTTPHFASPPLAPAGSHQAAPSAGQPSTVSDAFEEFRVSSPVPQTSGYFSSLNSIGQFHGEYILCQSGEDLVIIDQHAASERVAFQRLRQQFSASGVESQRLLFPETLELSFSEVSVSNRFRNELEGIGFELESFGGATILVSAVPRVAADHDPLRLVRDILHDLGQVGSSGMFRDRVDELLSRIACHSVVRGFHPLDTVQIRELLCGMDESDFAASCPHGRPVSHSITLAELERIFKRM